MAEADPRDSGVLAALVGEYIANGETPVPTADILNTTAAFPSLTDAFVEEALERLADTGRIKSIDGDYAPADHQHNGTADPFADPGIETRPIRDHSEEN